MWRLALIAAVAAVAAAGAFGADQTPLPVQVPTGYWDYCGTNPRVCPRGRAPTTLWRRTLSLPTVPSGATCPVSSGRRITQRFWDGLGAGPVYPTLHQDHKMRAYDPPGLYFEGTGWTGDKVVWFSAKSYRGSILIRGGRIDSPGELAFSHGGNGSRRPVSAVQLAPQSARPNGTGIADGYRWWGTMIWIKGPGCYAMQIDGTNFSTDVVFEAVPANPRER